MVASAKGFRPLRSERDMRRLRRLYAARDEAWQAWIPRPDCPAEFDQQTAFVYARDLVSFLLGGNGSGKTACAAKKCVNFLLNTPPPRRNTPFWILAEDYTQVCEVCWAEKLNGEKFLPDAVVDWANVGWYKPRQNWPLSVPLKPHRNGHNWRLEFRSYAQGWKSMQARSIGGFWFSEQVDWTVYLEVLRGCREYMYRGGQFLEFTPLQPELCVQLERLMDARPEGYGFYRTNTQKNANVSEDWKRTFFGAVPKSMLATRQTGALASFQGVIFGGFNVHTHTEAKTARIPAGVTHYRGIDWGFSQQHPFACVWGYRDGLGDIRVYAEYWSPETITARMHAKNILAISLAFGWPVPEEVFQPTRENLQFAHDVLGLADQMNPKRLGRQIDPKTRRPRYRPGEYGQTYADSSRPDCIAQCNQVGIYSSGGTHEVLRGIEEVQGLLEINPGTGKPHLMVNERCPHLIEEFRKYRWKTREDDGVKSHEPFKLGPFMKGEDTISAARYMVYNIRKSTGATIDSTARRPEAPQSMKGQFTRHEAGGIAKRLMAGQFKG